MASATTSRVRLTISAGSCSTHPGLDRVPVLLLRHRDREPFRSNTMNRVLEVP